jgi:hypothetical protein
VILRNRIILAIASVALLASLSAFLLNLLKGDYNEYCSAVYCVVDYNRDYWQLSVGALAVVASLAVVAGVVFAPRTDDLTSDSAPSARTSEPAISRRVGGTHNTQHSERRRQQRRDDANPLDNKPWLRVVEECVDVFDDLDSSRPSLGPEGQELADHVMYRLEEALERAGVEVISDDVAFERGRHKPEKADSVGPGATIAETLRPGFAVGPRVFRRARVRLDR